MLAVFSEREHLPVPWCLLGTDGAIESSMCHAFPASLPKKKKTQRVSVSEAAMLAVGVFRCRVQRS